MTFYDDIPLLSFIAKKSAPRHGLGGTIPRPWHEVCSPAIPDCMIDAKYSPRRTSCSDRVVLTNRLVGACSRVSQMCFSCEAKPLIFRSFRTWIITTRRNQTKLLLQNHWYLKSASTTGANPRKPFLLCGRKCPSPSTCDLAKRFINKRAVPSSGSKTCANHL